MAINEEQDETGERPHVLLAVDRAASHQSAAAVAATLAAALKGDVVAVEVGGGANAATRTVDTPADTILGAAEQLRPALVVLPWAGPSRPHTLHTESVAHEVIRRSTCPVLLVPLGREGSQTFDGLLSKTVLAVDASTDPKRARRAVERVAEGGAEVIVLHVQEVDRPEGRVVDHRIESVVAELQAAGFRVGVIKSHALPHRAAAHIAEVAHEVGAGMIVVGSGHGSLVARFLHSDMSADVLRRTPCPVLVER